MDRLVEQFERRIAHTPTGFVREISREIRWDTRLVGIRGARGVGKTTVLLQHIREHFGNDRRKVLYASLDSLWFADHNLLDTADIFVKQGGTHLFLDEVHKYPLWSQTIKNLYDEYPELYVVFTGSSLLEILNARADLSRRAVVYDMQGLSFREYLMLRTGQKFSKVSFEDLLGRHREISADIVGQVRPFEFLEPYLKTGYYPYFMEGEDLYQLRLDETISMILDIELPTLRAVDTAYVPKVRQLLAVIAESAPFIPNISRLSERIGITRQTLLTYLNYLAKAGIIRLLYRNTHGVSLLQKPDKIFLENTNLMFLLQPDRVDRGNLRETFVANQLSRDHSVTYTAQGDFLVDNSVTIEVGGRNKKNRQIQGVDTAYIAADNLEYGSGNRIPIWLFGFLY